MCHSTEFPRSSNPHLLPTLRHLASPPSKSLDMPRTNAHTAAPAAHKAAAHPNVSYDSMFSTVSSHAASPPPSAAASSDASSDSSDYAVDGLCSSAGSSSLHSASPNSATGLPLLRNTASVQLVGVLRVRTLLTTRRRLCRLEDGILTVHSATDECGDALLTTRLVDCESISSCDVKATITLKLPRSASSLFKSSVSTSSSTLTFAFKNDAADMYRWLAALTRARDMVLDRFYKVCERVGSGQYADVFRAVERKTGRSYAVKRIARTHATDRHVAAHLKREVDIVKRLRHRNVVEVVDVFETGAHVFIVMEYVEQGSLMQYLKRHNFRLSEAAALSIVVQLLRAVAYLHSQGVVHRDIKAENVLVTADGVVKLADFGLARRLEAASSRDDFGCGPGNDDEFCLSSILGTPAYCPPEVISRKPYGKAVDVYSTGVVAYVVLAGQLPFRGNSPADVFDAIARGRLTFPRTRWAMISPAARDFVRRVLNTRPSSRPTAAQALVHHWFSSKFHNGINTSLLTNPTPSNGQQASASFDDHDQHDRDRLSARSFSQHANQQANSSRAQQQHGLGGAKNLMDRDRSWTPASCSSTSSTTGMVNGSGHHSPLSGPTSWNPSPRRGFSKACSGEIDMLHQGDQQHQTDQDEHERRHFIRNASASSVSNVGAESSSSSSSGRGDKRDSVQYEREQDISAMRKNKSAPTSCSQHEEQRRSMTPASYHTTQRHHYYRKDENDALHQRHDKYYGPGHGHGQQPHSLSARPFRRAQSGSLRQLRLDRVRQRAGQLDACE